MVPFKLWDRPEALAGMIGKLHLPGNAMILHAALKLLIFLETRAAALIA